MKTSLVIMAAGIGSRFGGGVKQLTPVGPIGEIIIDYSIHDALDAGFNKIVFIIRKDIEQDFYEVIGKRIEKICDVEYVFQSLDDLPEGYEKPAERTKPWGTGQAVLCCRGCGFPGVFCGKRPPDEESRGRFFPAVLKVTPAESLRRGN